MLSRIFAAPLTPGVAAVVAAVAVDPLLGSALDGWRRFIAAVRAQSKESGGLASPPHNLVEREREREGEKKERRRKGPRPHSPHQRDESWAVASNLETAGREPRMTSGAAGEAAVEKAERAVGADIPRSRVVAWI